MGLKESSQADELRTPREIIADLLWFAEMDLADLSHPERYEDVKSEARAYLGRISADQAAWKRIQDSYPRWDPGL